MNQYFASYSRRDERHVFPIIQILRHAETKVFFDLDSITPGDNWQENIDDAIKSCTSLVLFWSEHSSISKWVRKEYLSAIKQNKEIVPVLLDNTPLPKAVKGFQWIDFSSKIENDGSHELLKKNVNPIANKNLRHKDNSKFKILIIILLTIVISLLTFLIYEQLSYNSRGNLLDSNTKVPVLLSVLLSTALLAVVVILFRKPRKKYFRNTKSKNPTKTSDPLTIIEDELNQPGDDFESRKSGKNSDFTDKLYTDIARELSKRLK